MARYRIACGHPFQLGHRRKANLSTSAATESTRYSGYADLP